MNKYLLTSLLLTSTAMAEVGVGYDAMLGGVSGLSVQKSISPSLYIQGIGNAEYDKGIGFNYGLGMRAAYTLASADQATLALGFGGGFVGDSAGVGSPFVEIPIGIDYRFGRHFSVTGATGIVYQTGEESKLVLFNQGGSNFLGSFAFHYWF